MKRTIIAVLAFFSLALASAQQFTPVKHVLVIGVDGLSPKGIQAARTPNLNKLMKTGAYSFTAQSVMPSVSSPNWASMIMGATPVEHGITSNEWERTDIREKTYCNGEKGETFPSVFRVIREKYPEGDIACFHDWDGFGRLVEPGVSTIIADCRGEDKTAQEAAFYLTTHQPLFTFVHLDHVDHAGHDEGWYTPTYTQAVEKLDKLVGELTTALQKANVYDQTVILVTADHGGIDKKHGGDTPEERTIPWIIAGPGIKKNVYLTRPIQTYDTAATLAYLLGCPAPACWIGKPVMEAFENKPEAVGNK
jgi:predicted AlkP superfamily pyrophosphatase or phosphodiesterase